MELVSLRTRVTLVQRSVENVQMIARQQGQSRSCNTAPTSVSAAPTVAGSWRFINPKDEATLSPVAKALGGFCLFPKWAPEKTLQYRAISMLARTIE